MTLVIDCGRVVVGGPANTVERDAQYNGQRLDADIGRV